mgnify:CR=1 FL=1
MGNHNLGWWTGQIIGVIAFSITALGFFQKDEKKLKTLLTISGFFWMANFWFLGAMTPFIITLVNTIRQFISRLYHNANEEIRVKLTYLFVGINIIMGFLSWQNWVSFFPTLAATMATISLFIWDSKKMRSGLLTSEFCWTVNNLYFMNFGGLCANGLNIPLLIYHIMKKDPLTMVEKDS